MKISFLVMLAFSIDFKVSAETAMDLGFRFRDGKCLDQNGKEGLNPAYFGQCGDLSGVRLGNFSLDGLDISGSVWKAVDLGGVSFKNARIVGVDFSSARFSGVDFSNSVIEKVDFTDAVFKNIVMFDAQLSQLVFKRANLSGAQLTYAEFKNSLFDEVDFSNADLSEAKFVSSKLNMVNFTNASLGGVVFNDSSLQKINFRATQLTGAEFSSMDLSDFDFSNAILQSAKFLKANLTRVKFLNADLTSSYLSGSFGTNVDFAGAKIGDSDLVNVNYTASNFIRADLSRTKLTGARLLSSDLRHAVFAGTNFSNLTLTGSRASKRTIVPVTPEQLMQMGVTLDSRPSVLILWDVQNESLNIFKKALESADIDVTLAGMIEYEFPGFQEGEDFDAVILLNGVTYARGMTSQGQLALVEYVKNGGKFIHTEWLAFEIEQGTMSEIKDLAILKRVSAVDGPIDYIPVANQAGHPLFSGIKDPMTVSGCNHNTGPVQSFATDPATALVVDKDGNAIIAERSFGKGKIFGFATAGNYGSLCLQDKNLQTYFINALNY